mgnify:CR=1 FL=1
MAFGFRGIRRHCGGCDGQADTPDPIPNSEVKRPGGENTLAGKIAAAAFFVAVIFFRRREEGRTGTPSDGLL